MINSHDEHHKNRFGVCINCAMEMAKAYAEHKAELWTNDPKEQRKVKDRFMWERFWQLTTPSGHGY